MSGSERVSVFVVGATGMLGNAIFRTLSDDDRLAVHGVVRDQTDAAKQYPIDKTASILGGFDAMRPETLESIMGDANSPVIINCVGLVKQLSAGNSVPYAAPVNAILPHRLAEIADNRHGRLIHFSTDCVFSGALGGYTENDVADARDVYGLTKYLGEVASPSAITLRTSIIGHGLRPNASLVDWFLNERGPVRGFRRAIFSGLPTVELARVVRDHVVPRSDLCGLYNVSAAPIDKFTLLQLIKQRYVLDTVIEPDDDFVIDRSLDSSAFREATGWHPNPWPELVASMHRDFAEGIQRHV